MAKGENLEKPKKGGMVIVIGVGKPPKKKKGDLKKSGPRRHGGGERTQRGTRKVLEEQMERNPNLISERMEQMGVEKDFMDKYMEHHHKMSVEEATNDENIDIMAEIRRARGLQAGLKGNFDEKGRPKPKLKALLERRRIPISTFKRSLKEEPFKDFEERMNDLGAGASEGRKREKARLRRENPRGSERKNPVLDDPDDILYQGGRGRLRPTTEEMYEDDHDIVREYPEDTHTRTGGLSGRGSLFYLPASTSSSTLPFASSGQTRRTPHPSMRAPAGSVESETYGFGAANPYAPTSAGSEDEEADLDRVQDLMMTGEPMNVMDAAWALLKANPEMQAQDGTTMHPSARIYAEMADAKQSEEEHGVHRSPEHRRKLARHMTTHRMNKPYVLGREAYLGNEHDEMFHNPAQRMPRPEEEEGGYVEQRSSALRPEPLPQREM